MTIAKTKTLKIFHLGPGNHPSGSSQDVHGGGGGSAPSSSQPAETRSEPKRFESSDEEGMTDYGRSIFENAKVPSKSLPALKKYKHDSDEIAAHLRYAGKVGTMQALVDQINTALDGSTLTEDLTVFRGVDPDWIPAVGTKFVDKSYLSTTLSEDDALGWSLEKIAADERPTILEFTLKAGSKALYLDVEEIEERYEYEVLLPRELTFEVIKKYERKMGTKLVDVFVLEVQ